MSEQLTFDLPTITVHCCFCPHVVQGTTDGAHDAMERHYESRHRALINGIVGSR